jgi:hypothetical protein
MIFIVAVAEDTLYGTRLDAIIFIQHSGERALHFKS